MNKYISILILWLCQFALVQAQTGGYGGDFDNPAEPSTRPGISAIHKLKLEATPQAGGHFSGYQQELRAGQSQWLHAYSNTDFAFRGWMEGDSVISTNSSIYYVMPDHDVTLRALFQYIPGNPETPGETSESLKRHALTFKAEPTQAASFNWSAVGHKFIEGEAVYVYPYINQDFEFVCWLSDKDTVSYNSSFYYTMPGHDATLTGVFRYNPGKPMSPGTNNWNETDHELIIDDFTTNHLYDAIYSTIRNKNISSSQVERITVIGRISESDMNAPNKFEANIIDFTRTTGLNYVPTRCFEYNQNLTEILLPASITHVNYGAFYDCQNIQTVTCMAMVPPTLEGMYSETDHAVFNRVDKENAVLYVPADAVEAYQQSQWSWIFGTIEAIQEDVTKLEVKFPGTDFAVSTYKDCTIELKNTKNGQTIKYVVTDRINYIFNNILKNTEWNVYLKNVAGKTLANINGVKVEDEMVSVTFEDILHLMNVKVDVFDKDNTNVTDNVSINWFDADGSLIGHETELKGKVEGDEVSYQVVLPQALGMEYYLPETVSATVSADAEENALTYTLQAIPTLTLSGKVVDMTDGAPIAGASITATQTINGKYQKSYAVTTSADGTWTATGVIAGTNINIAAKDYISQKYNIPDMMVALALGVANINHVTIPGKIENVNIALKPIAGAKITMALEYNTIAGEKTPYADFNNVSYTLYNKTQDKAIKLFSSQSPDLVILEEGVEEGDVFEVTATSRTGAFVPVKATTTAITANKAEVTIPIVQLGGINASYKATENDKVVALLYKDGVYVGKYNYNADMTLSIDELKDGTYSLVTMGETDMFAGITKISQFTELGLKPNTHYVLNSDIPVVSGKMTSVSNSLVPFINEEEFYYTGGETGISINKKEVSTGNYLTISAYVDFKSQYVSNISDVKLIVDIPTGVAFVDNSVMIGNNMASYELNGDKSRLSVAITEADYGQKIRFCLTPAEAGNYTTSAAVEFNYTNAETGTKSQSQAIGSVSYSAKSLSISVPDLVVNATGVPVSGTAKAGSTIDIYDNDVFVAEGKASKAGKWSIEYDLPKKADNEYDSDHNVYAKITTTDGLEMETESKSLLYDPEAIIPESVEMSFYNGWLRQTVKVNYDLVKNSADCTSYMFYTTSEFTFILKFKGDADNSKIKAAVVWIITDNGKLKPLLVHWNAKKKAWVGSLTCSWGELPTTIFAKWKLKSACDNCADCKCEENNGCEDKCTCDCSFCTKWAEDVLVKDDVIVIHPAPVTPIHDPSGYVYEGVHSNRIQGVRATVYYKEEVENMYGDLEENIVLWDAEEYGQRNPLFTDEYGMYQWDVPQGLWQVKFEKEGYETAYSEWLPVPPPQLEVNIAMTQKSIPTVKACNAYEEGVGADACVIAEIEFDKYMMVEDITTSNIYVTVNENPYQSTLSILDEEEYDGVQLASKVQLKVLRSAIPNDTKQLTVIVGGALRSYAGIDMHDAYNQTVDIKERPHFSVINDINVAYEKRSDVITVAALPAETTKGLTMNIKSLNSNLITILAAYAEVEAEGEEDMDITLDEAGNAQFIISGDLYGTAAIELSVGSYDGETFVAFLDTVVTVNVLDENRLEPVHAPEANRADGSSFYAGETVKLSCSTEGAKIYYSTDGFTTPAKEYKSPIAINANVTLEAYAEGIAGLSDTIKLTYTLAAAKANISLADGWNWISHDSQTDLTIDNIPEGVSRILSQTDELFNDRAYGWVGGLAALDAKNGYKVQFNGTEEVPTGVMNVSGMQVNWKNCYIPLYTGWNWIGYPLSEERTIAEALEELSPEEGDRIVGSTAFAEYKEGKWVGDLTVLQPGHGYMYKSGSVKDFRYMAAKASDARYRYGHELDLNPAPWEPQMRKYPDVMGVTAQLNINGEAFTWDAYNVGAFAGDECRGLGKFVGNRLFITVNGKPGEAITFRAENYATGEIFDISEALVFRADAVGSIAAPYVLTFSDAAATGVQSINTASMPEAIYTASGILVSRHADATTIKSLPKGIYFVQGRKFMVK